MNRGGVGWDFFSTHNLKDEDRMKMIRHKMVRDDDGNDYDVKMKFLVKDFFIIMQQQQGSINFNPIFPFSH